MIKALNNRNSGRVSAKAASTVFHVGDAVTESSGYLVAGGTGKVKGICNEEVQATDSDYASTRDLSFQAFKEDDEFEFDVTTGTATQAMVGTVVDIDSANTNPGGLNVSASSNKQVEITRFISAAKVWGKFVPQTS